MPVSASVTQLEENDGYALTFGVSSSVPSELLPSLSPLPWFGGVTGVMALLGIVLLYACKCLSRKRLRKKNLDVLDGEKNNEDEDEDKDADNGDDNEEDNGNDGTDEDDVSLLFCCAYNILTR